LVLVYYLVDEEKREPHFKEDEDLGIVAGGLRDKRQFQKTMIPPIIKKSCSVKRNQIVFIA